MLIFIKLGGSLITNKQRRASFRADIVKQIGDEISLALNQNSSIDVLIGHGSGSFGHFVAQQYGTANGVQTTKDWQGYAHVATVAAELHFLVSQILHNCGLPVLPIQPSASTVCRDGAILSMNLEPIEAALRHKLIPLVYGDVALDQLHGGTIISTESIFAYLSKHLPVERILLLGETAGVYNKEGALILEITRASVTALERVLSGSAGIDVTGGMTDKVHSMLSIVQQRPELTAHIMNGGESGVLLEALTKDTYPGTTIRA